MKRAGYRGRKPRGGLTPEQAAVAILTAMAAVLLMTMKVNSQWVKQKGRNKMTAVKTPVYKVSIQGRRVRIPRLAFIQYMEGGEENAVYAGGAGRDGGGRY